MVITIAGDPGEGKTELAKTITAGMKVVHIPPHGIMDDFYVKSSLHYHGDNVDFIIVDGIKSINYYAALKRATAMKENVILITNKDL